MPQPPAPPLSGYELTNFSTIEHGMINYIRAMPLDPTSGVRVIIPGELFHNVISVEQGITGATKISPAFVGSFLERMAEAYWRDNQQGRGTTEMDWYKSGTRRTYHYEVAFSLSNASDSNDHADHLWHEITAAPTDSQPAESLPVRTDAAVFAARLLRQFDNYLAGTKTGERSMEASKLWLIGRLAIDNTTASSMIKNFVASRDLLVREDRLRSTPPKRRNSSAAPPKRVPIPVPAAEPSPEISIVETAPEAEPESTTTWQVGDEAITLAVYAALDMELHSNNGQRSKLIYSQLKAKTEAEQTQLRQTLERIAAHHLIAIDAQPETSDAFNIRFPTPYFRSRRLIYPHEVSARIAGLEQAAQAQADQEAYYSARSFDTMIG